MAQLAPRIEQLLTQKKIAYEYLPCQATTSLLQTVDVLGLSAACVLRCVVLASAHERVIAVMPLLRILDFHALSRATGKDYEPVAVSAVTSVFGDCEPDTVPPFGMLYQLNTYCDTRIRELDQVIFEAGSRQGLVRLSGQDFIALMHEANFLNISGTAAQLGGQMQLDELLPSQLHHTHDDVPYHLPDCPTLLQQLQVLLSERGRQRQSLEQLLSAVPGLGEQLKRMASSDLMLGEQAGHDQSLASVIDRLGEAVCTVIAQGLLVWDQLTLPADGPLGRVSLLTQAQLSAALSYHLLESKTFAVELDLCAALEIALLHNCGYLVLAHLFAPEYFLFNRMVQARPQTRVSDIEQQLLAQGHARHMMQAGHAVAGSRLLQAWRFADVTQQACRHHHAPAYSGPQSNYVHMLMIISYLLGETGLGDAGRMDMPQSSLRQLGLSTEALRRYQEWLRPIIPGIQRPL